MMSPLAEAPLLAKAVAAAVPTLVAWLVSLVASAELRALAMLPVCRAGEGGDS